MAGYVILGVPRASSGDLFQFKDVMLVLVRDCASDSDSVVH